MKSYKYLLAGFILLAGSAFAQKGLINYYPNPNAGEFTLTFSGPKKPVIIRILDEKGNLMYEENQQNFSGYYNRVLNVKKFNRGKYLLQIHQQGKALNKKLILE